MRCKKCRIRSSFRLVSSSRFYPSLFNYWNQTPCTLYNF